MSGQASVEGLKYEHAHVDALGDDRWQEIVTLCTIAYDYQGLRTPSPVIPRHDPHTSAPW